MTDFVTSFMKTMGHEGGWSNTEKDRGGETFRGISRVYHGDWPGWPVLDGCKNKEGRPILTGQDAVMVEGMVQAFYEEKFWQKCQCHRLPSQSVAEELFDSAVNCGTAMAVGWLQEGINLLRHRADPFITEDGKMGEKTIAAVGVIEARGNSGRLVKLMNVMQGAHYLSLSRKDSSQRHFLIGGWLNRVTV